MRRSLTIARQMPADHAITQGSPLAKRQLTMGDCYEAAEALSALRSPPGEDDVERVADPLSLVGSCEDRRLIAAGYKVCGSHANREWHWQAPNGPWHDGYRSEEAAVRAAISALTDQQEMG